MEDTLVMSTTERELHDIHFRRIRPEDRARLQRFHKRLSIPTVAQRFHGAKLELSEPLARRFTEVNGHEEGAIVATTGTRGRIVGVARYFKLGAGSAEVAFVVEDKYQGRGIGLKLMDRIKEMALGEGIEEFIAYVLPGNDRMLHLLERTGPTTRVFDGGVYRVRVDLRRQSPMSGTGEMDHRHRTS
jgi:RimJ/RimL family protein N-acetyltransferase